MTILASRIRRIKPSPSSMAGQRARELQAMGRDIVALTAGEPDFDTPENIIDAAQRAMRSSQTKYTDVGGTPELKSAIRAKFLRENGLDYAQNEVMASTGAKQVIFNALMSTVEQGVEVIIPTPHWVTYPAVVAYAGGTPVLVAGSPAHGFKVQPDDLERAITPRTRWLILNAPGNPGGAVYSAQELQALAGVLLRHPHVWILTDDIYEHILYDERHFYTLAEVEPRLRGRTLTVNGVSKAYAMTGWRIGYAGGPGELIAAMTKMQSHSTSNPSSISQAAACEALQGPQDFIARHTQLFQQRRDRVMTLLHECPGIECAAPEGAFYAYPSCAKLMGKTTPQGLSLKSDAEFVLYLLEEENLAVLHGEAYGMSPYFRISFAVSMETLEEACRRLRRACEKLA